MCAILSDEQTTPASEFQTLNTKEQSGNSGSTKRVITKELQKETRRLEVGI
jgi:hypothetical protein